MTQQWFPLDPEPRLPRELVRDARRYKVVGRPEFAGALWLPALLVLMTIGAWVGWDGFQMVTAAGVLFVGLCVWIFWRRAGGGSADSE